MSEKEHLAHRDLKPSNILVNRRTRDADHETIEVKLSDFGCSKMYSLADYSKTRTIIGSPSFLSPQARQTFDTLSQNPQNQLVDGNGEKVDWDFFKADVFSLGLTLLCAATLKGVQGLNEQQQLLEARLRELKLDKEYSELVQVSITKMLMWEESRRPSFAQVRDYIRQYKDTSLAHIQDTNQTSINREF